MSIEATWIHPYCGLLVDFEGAVASMDVAVRLEMSMDTDEENSMDRVVLTVCDVGKVSVWMSVHSYG